MDSKENDKKYVDTKDKLPFINDMKAFKENLKIKDLLRSVKMKGSMRMKGPQEIRVMISKDSTESEVFTDDATVACVPHKDFQELGAINHNVVVTNTATDDYACEQGPMNNGTNDKESLHPDLTGNSADDVHTPNSSKLANSETRDGSSEYSEKEPEQSCDHDVTSMNNGTSMTRHQFSGRDRKLSLDHTVLARSDSRTQSEYDLYSLGKSPLERKSSFFKKKMESFVKNTTELFKRQSLTSRSQSIQRRGSMSASLQSLNENSITSFGSSTPSKRTQGSTHSLLASGLQGSTHSLQASGVQGSLLSVSGSAIGNHVTAATPSRLLAEHDEDVKGTSDQETLLNSRAISMGSGLDTAKGLLRRKSSARLKERSNRVTWIASEGLTNYFRRLVQDESGHLQGYHSTSDLSAVREDDAYGNKMDSKGRRLSYQRAVSGEDPSKYQDSLGRRHYIPEHSEANFELSKQLADFTTNGVPCLRGFNIVEMPDEAFGYLMWAEHPENMRELYDPTMWPPSEESRQAVIREFVTTEANYIRHLISIVEVFMAAAHALQDSGRLLDVDTERLYTNIPDVLNANLCFWEIAIYPMIADAVDKNTPFNTELMSNGFCHFREIFQPYEKYVSEQTKALDYFRSLSNNLDFQMYLSWCYSHKQSNRLQLADMMVKPMQRLTKYSLILRRIIQYTDTEPERTNLIAMESFAKNYVLDVNRSIRQKEELEKIDALSYSIEGYEIDFKDDDMDKYFRMFSQLNLKAPMVNCLPSHSRTLIHQGDLRFRDHIKEMDVRAFLLTDMLLICKKLSKGSIYPYKLIRPKYMVDRILQFTKHSPVNSKDFVGMVCLMLDEVGSSSSCFHLTAPAKDSSPHATLKLWDQKIKEAKLTYDFGVWYAKNPSRDLSDVEIDTSSDYGISGTSVAKSGRSSDEINIEREARERVAAMLHRSMGASTDCDFSQASMNTDSIDAGEGSSGARVPLGLRHPMQRNSTGGSSRLSSFHHSTSAASHDEPQTGPGKYNYRAGSSVEHLIPPLNPDDTVTSITVNVVSESESETVVTEQRAGPSPSSTSKMGSRSPSVFSHNTLRVQPASGVMALVHSLPDLTVEPSSPSPRLHNSITPSASEKLYQSHQEILQRNRLSASHHQYLSPDHRGTSYPPPSPTRASLKRGLAFSYSFKNPPLSKMGHVYSQSQLQAETGPSAGHPINPIPSTSSGSTTEKPDKSVKKTKQITGRHKGSSSGSQSGAGNSRKDGKGD